MEKLAPGTSLPMKKPKTAAVFHKSMVHLIRDQEIYGNGWRVRKMRQRLRLRSLVIGTAAASAAVSRYPATVISEFDTHAGSTNPSSAGTSTMTAALMGDSSGVENIERFQDGIFMGLSHESRYLVCHLQRPFSCSPAETSRSEDSDEEEDEDIILGTNSCDQALVILDLTPRCLKKRVAIRLKNYSNTSHIYAFFPRDSSFMATVSYPIDQITGMGRSPAVGVQLRVDMVALATKYPVHVSMAVNALISCRCQAPKLAKNQMRIYDHGVLINAGTCLISINLFDKTRCGSLISSAYFQPACNRSVWNLYCSDSRSPLCNGNRLTDMSAAVFFGGKGGECRLKFTPFVANADSIDIALLSETWLEVEPIIDREMRRISPLHRLDYRGVIDYEIDILDVNDEVAYVLLTCLIEVSTLKNPRCFVICIIQVKWDLKTGEEQSVTWHKFRSISSHMARAPDQWYPFRSVRRSEAVEERAISNAAFFSEKSLQMLSSYYGGIDLVL